MSEIKWEIHRQGRAWRGDEVLHRWELFPEKVEMFDGKLFWTEEERLTVLALLLENVGIDKAIRLGDADVWREALSKLD